jgi:DNA-binding transcriptional MerR regulator
MSVAAPPAASTAKSPAPRDPQRIYSIAELSREFAITPRTIRFYEDEGLIKPRRQGLTRLYSAGDRTRLSWILRGKRLGFSLAELRELLRRSRLHIADLERKRSDLDAHINEFKEVETQVSAELRHRGVDPESD